MTWTVEHTSNDQPFANPKIRCLQTMRHKLLKTNAYQTCVLMVFQHRSSLVGLGWSHFSSCKCQQPVKVTVYSWSISSDCLILVKNLHSLVVSLWGSPDHNALVEVCGGARLPSTAASGASRGASCGPASKIGGNRVDGTVLALLAGILGLGIRRRPRL